MLKAYKFDCRCCGGLNLKRVVSLGYQPLANNLLKTKNEKTEMFPLEVNYCENCHNCQLSVAVKAEKIAWHGTWKGGLTEAQRTGKPIMLVSAVPQCHSVPGVW